jgi:hypothetical protein
MVLNMSDPFEIIKDSSIWFNSQNFAAVNKFDGLVRVGVVKKAVNDGNTSELRYLVEIQNSTDKIELNCVLMRRFGGVYNYEDYIYQGYKINDKPDPVSSFAAKAGDAVLVCFLNGQGREGVILGGITHTARTSKIRATDGPQYMSEFNGVETSINKDGEYTVTFKGQPTNIAQLNNSPSNKIPAPTYNTNIGTSFFKFDKTGSFEVSDKATDGIQNLKIDKSGGTLTINSGKTFIKLTKQSNTVDITTKYTNILSDVNISMKTKEFSVNASTSASINSPKVAIGKDGVELLDQLSQLVDALGKVMAISPVGPCSTLMSSPGWSEVQLIQLKIKQITGSL